MTSDDADKRHRMLYVTPGSWAAGCKARSPDPRTMKALPSTRRHGSFVAAGFTTTNKGDEHAQEDGRGRSAGRRGAQTVGLLTACLRSVA